MASPLTDPLGHSKRSASHQDQSVAVKLWRLTLQRMHGLDFQVRLRFRRISSILGDSFTGAGIDVPRTGLDRSEKTRSIGGQAFTEVEAEKNSFPGGRLFDERLVT
jgi:hypothetical protein